VSQKRVLELDRWHIDVLKNALEVKILIFIPYSMARYTCRFCLILLRGFLSLLCYSQQLNDDQCGTFTSYLTADPIFGIFV